MNIFHLRYLTASPPRRYGRMSERVAFAMVNNRPVATVVEHRLHTRSSDDAVPTYTYRFLGAQAFQSWAPRRPVGVLRYASDYFDLAREVMIDVGEA